MKRSRIRWSALASVLVLGICAVYGWNRWRSDEKRESSWISKGQEIRVENPRTSRISIVERLEKVDPEESPEWLAEAVERLGIADCAQWDSEDFKKFIAEIGLLTREFKHTLVIEEMIFMLAERRPDLFVDCEESVLKGLQVNFIGQDGLLRGASAIISHCGGSDVLFQRNQALGVVLFRSAQDAREYRSDGYAMLGNLADQLAPGRFQVEVLSRYLEGLRRGPEKDAVAELESLIKTSAGVAKHVAGAKLLEYRPTEFPIIIDSMAQEMSSSERDFMIESFIFGAMRKDPGKALTVAVGLKNDDYREVSLRLLVREWVRKDPMPLSKAVNMLPKGRERSIAAAEIVSYLEEVGDESAANQWREIGEEEL